MKRKYTSPELEKIVLTLGNNLLAAVSDPEGGHGSAGEVEGPNEGDDF